MNVTPLRNAFEPGLSKVYMAEFIGKDSPSPEKLDATGSAPTSVLCPSNALLTNRQCSSDCADYIPFLCSRRDRSPGACNGSSKYRSCCFDKFRYAAVHAEDEYQTNLKDSRMGADLTTSEAKWIGSIVAPLLKHGLSPYQIIQTHPELKISVRTPYNYIDENTLHEVAGIMKHGLASQGIQKDIQAQSPLI